jgi:phospho-N-acetylmuramoyl-pentapeptide-transferase
MKLGLLNLLICFLLSIIISPFIIKFLRRLKFGQSILIYVEKHKEKSGTPTMGGIIFIISTLIGYLIFFRENNILATITMLSFLFFGILGFLDDFIKIKYKQNEGLKPYQKIIGQFGIAFIISLFVYFSNLVGSECYIPFTDKIINLGFWIIPFVIFIYLAIVNSVNLIDGLDGLCSGVSTIVIFVFAIILYLTTNTFDGVYLNEINNLAVSVLGCVGALLGFMTYNWYPAKVFMGDTGSLALGGLIASITVFSKNYFLIVIIGFMLVLTTVSVIMQVVSFKLTGKRIFKMSPIHHHFEQTCHETKVSLIYIVVTICIGVLTILLYL